MPSFGIIVEGYYDVAVFSALVPRIRPGAEVARPIQAGGSPLMRILPGALQGLQFNVTPEGPVDRALVIRDSNGKDPQRVEQDMRDRIGNRTYNFPRGFAVHAVRQKMETWLLADPEAISTVAGGRPVAPVGGALEDLLDAKERFLTVLINAGLLSTPETCARIAQELKLEVLRARCPGFVRFEEKVLADS